MELEFCTSHGIPHSRFLSWSEQDQDKALLWMIEERSKCPSCGTHHDEWWEAVEDGKGKEQPKSPPPYVAETRTCLGCEILGDAREQIPDNKGNSVHIHLVPYTRERMRKELSSREHIYESDPGG
jgi:hypothetical protein